MKCKNILSLGFILMIAVFMACGSDDTPKPYTYTDVENAFQEFEFKAGTQDLSLKVSETLNYNFRVIIPNVNLNQNLPLIFALHYDANGDVNVHKETACYVEPGLASLDAIIISPNGGETVWGTTENQDKIRILVDLASRYWPVNLERVAVMGYSSGGNGTWFFTETQPQIFSAGIAIASGYNTLRPDNTARKMTSPLYVIHGMDDDFFPIDTVSYWIDRTVAVGSDITFVKAPNLDHYEPCAYVPYINDGALWLRDEIWK